MSYAAQTIRQAESREDAERDYSDFRDRADDALVALPPHELAAIMAGLCDSRALYEMLTGQSRFDYLDAMPAHVLAKLAGVSA